MVTHKIECKNSDFLGLMQENMQKSCIFEKKAVILQSQNEQKVNNSK
jgi:hypothetical protein